MTPTKAYIIAVVTNLLIVITTWLAMIPPRSPWIFAIGGAGILLCVGIIRFRARLGHFDKD